MLPGSLEKQQLLYRHQGSWCLGSRLGSGQFVSDLKCAPNDAITPVESGWTKADSTPMNEMVTVLQTSCQPDQDLPLLKDLSNLIGDRSKITGVAFALINGPFFETILARVQWSQSAKITTFIKAIVQCAAQVFTWSFAFACAVGSGSSKLDSNSERLRQRLLLVFSTFPAIAMRELGECCRACTKPLLSASVLPLHFPVLEATSGIGGIVVPRPSLLVGTHEMSSDVIDFNATLNFIRAKTLNFNNHKNLNGIIFRKENQGDTWAMLVKSDDDYHIAMSPVHKVICMFQRGKEVWKRTGKGFELTGWSSADGAALSNASVEFEHMVSSPSAWNGSTWRSIPRLFNALSEGSESDVGEDEPHDADLAYAQQVDQALNRQDGSRGAPAAAADRTPRFGTWAKSLRAKGATASLDSVSMTERLALAATRIIKQQIEITTELTIPCQSERAHLLNLFQLTQDELWAWIAARMDVTENILR